VGGGVEFHVAFNNTIDKLLLEFPTHLEQNRFCSPMKLTLNKFFLSKRGARKTVALGYIVSISVFFVGMMSYHEYRKYGNISIRGTLISGNDALITAVATIAVSVVIFLIAIYVTVMYLFFHNRADFGELPPSDVLICSKCQTPVPANETSGSVCPKCGGNLEDVKGFYTRHPEFKEIANE